MRKRKSKAIYIAAIIGGIIILLAAGLGIFLIRTNELLKTVTLVRTVPNPNAYDYYVDAAMRIVMTADIDDARIRPKRRSSSYKPKRTYTLNEKKAIIAANAPALDGFREGIKYKCLSPLIYPTSSSASISGVRTLARLISLETQVYNQSGEPVKAVQSCLDGLQLSSDTAQGSNLVGYLTSAAASTINIHNATPDLINKLSVKDAQDAATRLERITSNYYPFVEIMRTERYTNLQAMKSIVSYASSTMPPPTSMQEAFDGFIGGIQTGFMLSGLIADWNSELGYSAGPYAKHVNSTTPSYGPLMQILASVIRTTRFKYEYTLCTNQMLMLQLALRSYKATTGSYPAKLSDLTPRYLKQIPTDRFAPTGTYKYKQTAKGYILYNVGPDGKDDKGTPITANVIPYQTDHGDIVVEHIK
jgi:hypothetical protein